MTYTQGTIVKEFLSVKDLEVEFDSEVRFKGTTLKDEKLAITVSKSNIKILIENEVHVLPLENVEDIYYWSYDGKVDNELKINTKRFSLEFDFEKKIKEVEDDQ